MKDVLFSPGRNFGTHPLFSISLNCFYYFQDYFSRKILQNYSGNYHQQLKLYGNQWELFPIVSVFSVQCLANFYTRMENCQQVKHVEETFNVFRLSTLLFCSIMLSKNNEVDSKYISNHPT